MKQIHREIRREFKDALPAILDGTDWTIRPYRPSMAPLTISDIIQAISDVTGISVCSITGPRRDVEIIPARFVGYLLATELLPDKTLPQIAKAFRRADHTTIMHGAKVCRDQLQGDDGYQEIYTSAREILNG